MLKLERLLLAVVPIDRRNTLSWIMTNAVYTDESIFRLLRWQFGE